MLALAMDESAVKNFMGNLLREDIFDNFDVRNVELLTTTRITIDGKLENVDSNISAKGVFSSWKDLRPLVYTIIKSGAKPQWIKIVFSYKATEATTIHSNAAALFLNLTYENNGITFTTATSQKEFALDKSLDTIWEEWIYGLFAKLNISVTVRE